MDWVETTGKTIEEAKELALDQLGVDEHDAEFQVLEEPKTGLFGRLRSEARVRARIMPMAARPRVDRRDRGRRRRERVGGDADRSDRPATPAAPTGAAHGGSESSEGATARRRPRRRGGRGRNAGARPQNAVGTSTPDADDAGRGRGRGPGPEGGDMTEGLSLADEAANAVSFVEGLLEVMGLPGTVSTRQLDEETVEVAVEGDDLGLLIGPKGQTLAAIQELTRTAVQRSLGGRAGRLLIDVGGYRERRREALERFTLGVAEEVRASGVPRVLEPMGPADRKVVHDTVNDLEGVRTTSEGEEPRRHVVVLPETPAATSATPEPLVAEALSPPPDPGAS